jgi:hypothetical protein
VVGRDFSDELHALRVPSIGSSRHAFLRVRVMVAPGRK